ncbi:MAG: 7TM diverse intracellular signaling domain-containing protein, partial [Flavitalea sp.]
KFTTPAALTAQLQTVKWLGLVSLALILAGSLLPHPALAQEPEIAISNINRPVTIEKIVKYELAVPGTMLDNSITRLPFATNIPENALKRLPKSWVEKTLFLRFTLRNDTAARKCIGLYPGPQFTECILYKASPAQPNQLITIRDSVPEDLEIDGYRLITLEPFEHAVIYAQLRFLRSSQNKLEPQLMNIEDIDKHKALSLVKRSELDIVTYLASGMMMMMILYSFAAFWQNKNLEYLYYALYAFATGMLLFFISFLGTSLNRFSFFYTEYLDLMVLGASVFFYLGFMRNFLSTKTKHPFIERVFGIWQILIIVMMIIYSCVYFMTSKYYILQMMEDLSKICFLIIGVIFIIYGTRNEDKLIKFPVRGNIAVVVFGSISLIMLITNFRFTNDRDFSLLNRPLFWYEIGIVIELMFFLSGLSYKNRLEIVEQVRDRERLKRDNERKEFEKQMAVMAAQQSERDRISADMHDELGSGVTAIRLMSEIVKSKLKSQSLPEIDKISNSANELLNKMNTIIWTMKSSNDTLESMIAYLRANAIEYFDGTSIDCIVNTPANIPQLEMSGEKRRNIFLGVKESLTNIIKHAQATEVVINITAYNDQLVVEVADNGKGMDVENTRRFGNGLANMRRRMEIIGGTMTILQNNGTTLRFELAI